MSANVLASRALVVVVVAASILGGAAGAMASTVTIPAAAFTSATYLAAFGVIQEDAAATHRVAVNFPVTGETVCRLTFWVHDSVDPENVTAVLMRKLLSFSEDSFGQDPEVVATASSTGAVDNLRAFSSTQVLRPVIRANYAYWVELQFNGGPIQVAGVRIHSAATC